jgi:hypothetical protein
MRQIMKSILKRISALILTALLAAAAMGLGCHHTDLGPLAPIVKVGGWGEAGPDTRVITVSLGTMRVHSIDIEFNSPMDESTIEPQVTDETGEEVQFVKKVWSDRSTLNLKGPFAFCTDYNITIRAGAESMSGVTLKEDITLTANIKNPYDVDQDDSCTADIALSPLFTDGPDSALLTSISREIPFKELNQQAIDKDDTFYVNLADDYGFAEPLIRVPFMSGDGSAGLAQLFWREERDQKTNQLLFTHYTMNLWDIYDPLYEKPTSTIFYEVPNNSVKRLHGPFYAGDLDGDGISDLILSAEIALSWSVYQEVFIIKGPVAYGDGILLTDIAGTDNLMGAGNEVINHLLAVGDLNGDGKDDLAVIRNDVSSYGWMSNWQVLIMKGKEALGDILTDTPDTIDAAPAGKIVDLDADDVNGDGISDLIIAELESKYIYSKKENKNITPHIGIFFGGGSMDGLSMIEPDSLLDFRTNRATEETYLSVRSLGDVNGDGMADIGILVTEKDSNKRTLSSKVYVFMGRKTWFDSYFMNFFETANVIIDADGYGEIYFDAAMTGDIDNDGYYDFMIVADDGVDKTAYFFFGKNGYTNTGWELTLSDADVIWTFRNP